MCRLLGLIRTNENANLPAWQQLVGAPNSLRVQAETGCVPAGEEAGHDDSWGIGWFDSAGEVSLVRNTGSALESAYYVFAAETAARGGAGSGPGQTILGHLRKASMGTISSENAHPIRADYRRTGTTLPPRPYDTLLVAHNGTLKSPLQNAIRPDVIDAGREEGRADSDTVLLTGWLARHLDARTGEEPFEVLADALQELFAVAELVAADAAGGDLTQVYTAVNLLIAHPTGLYALRQFSREGEYYTLYYRPLTPDTDEGASGFLVASERTDDRNDWIALPPGELTHFAPTGTIRTAPVA